MESLFQNLDFSNWNESEKVCEIQQLSITFLQCEQNNVTSCLNNFTLSYKDETVPMSLEETSSSVLENKLMGLQAFQNRGPIRVDLVNSTEANITIFNISFCFTDPRGGEMLKGAVADKKAFSLNITRLVAGESAQDFQLVFDDQPHLPSKTLQPGFSKQNIEDVLKDWFSVKCELSRKLGRQTKQTYICQMSGPFLKWVFHDQSSSESNAHIRVEVISRACMPDQVPHFSRWSVLFGVSGTLGRTVFSDWCFGDLSGTRLQSHESDH